MRRLALLLVLLAIMPAGAACTAVPTPGPMKSPSPTPRHFVARSPDALSEVVAGYVASSLEVCAAYDSARRPLSNHEMITALQYPRRDPAAARRALTRWKQLLIAFRAEVTELGTRAKFPSMALAIAGELKALDYLLDGLSRLGDDPETVFEWATTHGYHHLGVAIDQVCASQYELASKQ